jgi:hypothetical protein
VTATAADGSTAQASTTITALALTLSGPQTATYGRRAVFKGRLIPALSKISVSLYAGDVAIRTGKTDKKGRFHFRYRPRSPQAFTARYGTVVSPVRNVSLRPGLDVALPKVGILGGRLVVRAAVRPSGAGTIAMRIWRGGRELRPRTFGHKAALRLDTHRVTNYVVRVSVVPAGTFSSRVATFRTNVYLPYLAEGARGPSVRLLERRLAELRYALRGVDGFYSYDTADAVLAFQKVHGMARTGRVDPSFWQRLQSARAPQPRYRAAGHHIEVDKTRQVLFEVDHGRVIRVIHVSTGATGNTPVGRWHIYSKVPGYLPSGMFYSSFFLRGFAIHGYHSVPTYPASHGCVRIPIWVAPTLYAANSYGETIYIYY